MNKINKNINHAQALLEVYAKDSLSYFTLHEKKKFFFSSTAQSFLSYTIIGKIALVSGDPVGPIAEIPMLLKEFEYFAKGGNFISCFVAVNQETLEILVRLGYKQLHIGGEAVITLSRFEKNVLKRKVRRAERHILNQGIVCKIYKRKDIPFIYLNQLQSITEEWIAHKGGKEKRLTMTLGRIPTDLDKDCEIVLGLKNETVIGYLTFAPIYASRSLSLDASKNRKDVPNGLTEFLLIQAFDYFKQQGVRTISLNFATFYQTVNSAKKDVTYLFIGLLYKFLRRLYKTDSLYSFNNKFLPNWQARYIAFPKRRYLPNYLYAIAKSEL